MKTYKLHFWGYGGNTLCGKERTYNTVNLMDAEQFVKYPKSKTCIVCRKIVRREMINKNKKKVKIT